MIRLQVIKITNTRIGGPSTTFLKGKARFPAEEIEVAQRLKGERINGNDNWYFDGVDKYYWSGGVEEIVLSHATASSPVPSSSAGIDYRKQIKGLPPEWFLKNGKGVKVAVLDTGFFMDHPCLQPLKARAVIKDFAGNGNTTDLEGHGSHVLGLIAAHAAGAEGITGLVPDADLFLYKVSIDDIGMIDSFIAAAINECTTRHVDIINLSLDVPSKENSVLHQAIVKAQAQGILVVAAAGENDDLVHEGLVYPAQFNGVIAVGEADKNFAAAFNTSFNPALDLILPFTKQTSCGNKQQELYKGLSGSSMAAAVISGVLAAMVSSGISKPAALTTLKSKAKKFDHQSIASNELIIYTL